MSTDPGMTLMLQLISRQARSRATLCALIMACGLGAIAYWLFSTPTGYFLERELTIHRVFGALGVITVAICGALLAPALRNTLRPETNPAVVAVTNGSVQLLQHGRGTYPTVLVCCPAGNIFINGSATEVQTLAEYLHRRLPHVAFQDSTVIIKPI